MMNAKDCLKRSGKRRGMKQRQAVENLSEEFTMPLPIKQQKLTSQQLDFTDSQESSDEIFSGNTTTNNCEALCLSHLPPIPQAESENNIFVFSTVSELALRQTVSHLSTTCSESNLDDDSLGFDSSEVVNTVVKNIPISILRSPTNPISSSCTIPIQESLSISKIQPTGKQSTINGGSFTSREHTKKWGKEETERFYKGLELFGTDFSMVSRLFTVRSRKMCKNKFRKEEIINAQEIEDRLNKNKQRRMNRVAFKVEQLKQTVDLNSLSLPERIVVITAAKRDRFSSFNSIDSTDINVVETIQSQVQGRSLFYIDQQK